MMYYEAEMCIKFGGSEGHGGIKYAGTITVQMEQYGTQRLVSS